MRVLSCILVMVVLVGCRAEPAGVTAHAEEVAAGEAVPATAADWPQFRGPGGMGVSAQKGPLEWGENKNIVWKVELPGAGASSPVTFGDRIYLTCYAGYGVQGKPDGDMTNLKRWVCCLSRDDGKLLWKTEVESKLPEQRSIREGHGYASNTSVVDGEAIYSFFGKSGVVAHDHEGKQLWHADVGSGLNGWGSAASPILWKNLLIVNASVESQSLIALDKRGGMEVWRARGINESWNTPLLVNAKGRTELVVAIMGKVLAFDPDTGAALWNCRTNIPWYMVPGLVSEEGVIYCLGGRSGGGLAIRAGGSGDVSKSHLVWTTTRNTNVPSPILYKGHLYWASDNQGALFCADIKTGAMVYEQRLDGAGQLYASPVLPDGKIYYLTRTGRFYVVEAAPELRIVAQNDMPRRDRYDSTPAFSRGQLLLRTDRYLYCIGG